MCRPGPGGTHIGPRPGGEAILDCPNCKDGSCGFCRSGEMWLARCVCNEIPAYIRDMMYVTQLAEDGVALPVPGGGTLNQTAGFLEAATFLKREREYWKNFKGKE